MLMMNVLRVRIRTHALVLVLYAALAVATTWPLVQHLSTHVPGSYTWAFDEYTFLWNTWWFRHTLFDLGQSPLYSTHTFYPLGISLVLYTYNLFNALVSLPFQSILSLPAISNLTFLLATVLSGYGAFLLVESLLRDTQKRISTAGYAAAFLAGLIYAFGSYRLVYAAIGHYDMWSTEWIPFYTLFLFKTVREARLRNAIYAGVFLVLAMLCEMIFGVFLGMLTLIVLAFALNRRQRAAVAGGPKVLIRRLAVMGLVAILLYSPVLLPILREMLVGYELAAWGDAEKLSVDLLGLVTPTALHPLGGDWTETLRQTREGTARFRDVNTVFLGWAGLGLAALGVIGYRRRIAAWLVSFVTFTIFGLGPLLQINGRSAFDLDGLTVNLPLPFILLHYTPIIKANRVPNRFSVVMMLALAVLAGFGAHWLLERATGSRKQASDRSPAGRSLLAVFCFLLLAALLLFEHWSVPVPLTDARIPPIYDQVAAEPGDWAILQLPLGWRNSFGVQGAESTQTQYYQTYHHKRLLSGNISRNPAYKFDYFRQIPILDSLITLQTYGQVDAERRAADRATADDFVSYYDLRYVVVAPGVPGRPPYIDTRNAAVDYIEQVLPVDRIDEQNGWLLYRIDQGSPSTTLDIDFGSQQPLAIMALGEGWGGDETIQGHSASWTVAQHAEVFLPAPELADHRLSLTALPFDYPDAAQQTVTPYVNGHHLEKMALAPGWNTYTWEVAAPALRAGLNQVRFEFDHMAVPADVLPGNGAIGATGIQAPQPIEVNSGGPLDFAYITVGDDDGSAHGPGYNVAVVHPRTGKLLDRQFFDTTPGGAETQAETLAAYVASLPDGQIVVVALRGDGAALLTGAAVDAFRAIGGQADPRGTTGWSHAIIGVKGSAPGTAAEAAGPDSGWLRVAPDRRSLAIAVDALHWTQTGPRE
jgi:hypothetical protein